MLILNAIIHGFLILFISVEFLIHLLEINITIFSNDHGLIV